jgi:hypothetical protein
MPGGASQKRVWNVPVMYAGFETQLMFSGLPCVAGRRIIQRGEQP